MNKRFTLYGSQLYLFDMPINKADVANISWPEGFKLEPLMSSERDDWETPHDLFDNLNDKYNFVLDPAASHENAKCKIYYTVNDNGLVIPWHGNVWLNPPYGDEVGEWVKKAYNEVAYGDANLVIVLLPARTDTAFFHDYVMKATNIYFIKGRLRFVGAKDYAPFPSMLVKFDKGMRDWTTPQIFSCDKIGNVYVPK